MYTYATIQELVDTLTPEEREQHREIISECLTREARLNKITASRQQAISKLINSFSSLVKGLDGLSDAAQQTLGETKKTLGIVQNNLQTTKKTLLEIRTQRLTMQKPVGSA